MNIINAQVEVLKEALNVKRKHRVVYGTLNDKVIIGNDTRLYVIPKKDCAIDLTNVFCVHVLQESTLKGFVNDSECEELTLMNDIRVLEDQITLRVFTNGKENIYLDERLIKNFDLKHSTFKGKGPRSVVYIYENEVMVGFLLPVRI